MFCYRLQGHRIIAIPGIIHAQLLFHYFRSAWRSDPLISSYIYVCVLFITSTNCFIPIPWVPFFPIVGTRVSCVLSCRRWVERWKHSLQSGLACLSFHKADNYKITSLISYALYSKIVPSHACNHALYQWLLHLKVEACLFLSKLVPTETPPETPVIYYW